MGTNYYLESDVCPTCKRHGERLHIGKSSAGWCFSLHVDAQEGITSLADWQARWAKPGVRIVDEYAREITPDQMLATITKRGRDRPREDKPYGYSSWAEFHRRNYSQDGPNGLLRHSVALDNRCIAHGDGTYDLIIGEFS